MITYRPDGSYNRYSWVMAGAQRAGYSIMDHFISRGWHFVPGSGYYDKEWNLAYAYEDGEFVIRGGHWEGIF